MNIKKISEEIKTNRTIAKALRVNRFEVLRPELTDLEHNVYNLTIEFDGREYEIEYALVEESGNVELQPVGDRDQLLHDLEETFGLSEYDFDSWEIVDFAVNRVVKFEEEEGEEEEGE